MFMRRCKQFVQQGQLKVMKRMYNESICTTSSYIHITQMKKWISSICLHTLVQMCNCGLQQLPAPRDLSSIVEQKVCTWWQPHKACLEKLYALFARMCTKLYAWLCIDFRYQKWKCEHTWLCVCVSISMQVKNQICLALQNLFGHQWWRYVNAKAISYVLWYYVTILTERKSILNVA